MGNKKFTVYYYFSHGEDGPSVLEKWGVFDAANEGAAIEVALADQYPNEAESNVAPIFEPIRSKELDRPHLSAEEDEPPQVEAVSPKDQIGLP